MEKIITISECWEQRHQEYWDKRGGKPDFVKGVQALKSYESLNPTHMPYKS